MSKIGLLGGTFNPIHVGHIQAAKIVLQKLKLDKVLLLPSGKPPLKDESNLLNFETRCKLVGIALQDEEALEVSKLDKSDGEKSFTAKLIKKLTKIYNDDFYFIIGEDNVTELPLWHDFKWLIENVQFVVITRNIGNRKEMKNVPYYSKLHFVEMEPINVSSTQIRTLIFDGKSICDLVPKSIEKQVIEEFENFREN